MSIPNGPDSDGAPDPSATLLVMQHVRNAIRAGRLSPGERVRERELTAACGVSRSAIREALRALAAEGTIALEHRRGAVVRQFSRAELWDYHQVREALEGLACALAAGRARLEDRRELLSLERRMAACAESGETDDYLKLNQLFHALIVEMSGNPVIQQHLDRALTAQVRLQSARFIDAAAIRQSHAEHGAIVEAILNGDPAGAERAMRHHLRHTRRTFLEMPDSFVRPNGAEEG
ncbi:MAG TPA: GntR family transcriptional regulator [Allosphingosinicella sp.]|nr:GntR family transcriptional regulator [Allosphingosinicella sp.]